MTSPQGRLDNSPGPACAHRGSALITVLLVLMLTSLLAASMATAALSEIELLGNVRGATRAFYAADGGAEKAFHDLLQMVRLQGDFPADGDLVGIGAPPLASITYSSFDVAGNGARRIEQLPLGFYQGLMAETQPYRATITAATSDFPPSNATVEMLALLDIIPVFQFAVFYENDLEAHPGPNMTLNGRVHGNHDIYFGAGNNLRIPSTVTAAGDIYNKRKDNPSQVISGDVEITDSDGIYRAMNGLDSDDPNWKDLAIERWDGTVRSREQNARRLELAIQEYGNPHLIVEPGRPADTAADVNGKIFYQAQLRILNGQAFDENGNVVSIIDPVTTTSALRFTQFEDQREAKVMATVEIDVAKLGRSPGFPANGVIYIGAFQAGDGMPPWTGTPPWDGYAPPWDAADETEFAIKLTNGNELPAPMTVVSENPVYIHGHYNRTNKVPAAVMGDAITILSRRWGDLDNNGTFDSDWDHSQLSLNNRRAKNTTVNAAFILGSTTTVVGQYNGGLENLPRFLERWSGRTFTYSGSLVNLWNSTYADGDWRYGNPVYTAPVRAWGFDTDFLDITNQPPAAPNIYTLRITGWNRPQS